MKKGEPNNHQGQAPGDGRMKKGEPNNHQGQAPGDGRMKKGEPNNHQGQASSNRGLGVTASVQSEALDPWAVVLAHQGSNPDLAGKFGATSVFVGTMRDFNDGESVRAMTLEHYPGMTESHLARVCAEASERWQIVDTLVVHRVGELLPDDPIVVVAVWSAHRDAAFGACRYIIDELKHRAPFWKQEATKAGRRWVAAPSQSELKRGHE